jgi:cytochrome c553
MTAGMKLLRGCMLLAAACAQAGERVTPRDAAVLAATCVTCHGPGGAPAAGAQGGIPSLRGHSADWLLQRLRAFKAQGPGAADAGATIMPLLLQGYGDAQIEALAHWFGEKERP